LRYLTLNDVLELYRRVVELTGGSAGLRDLGILEAAVAQPRMTFGATDLCPGLPEKAVALAFSPITSHPFLDGNKRVGHAAIGAFLILKGGRCPGHGRVRSAHATGGRTTP